MVLLDIEIRLRGKSRGIHQAVLIRSQIVASWRAIGVDYLQLL